MSADPKRIRRILLGASLGLLAWLAWQAWALAEEANRPAERTPILSPVLPHGAGPASRPAARTRPQRTVEDDAVIWARNLRQQIGREKPVVAPPPPRPLKPVPFKLVGTFVQPAGSHAIIQRGGDQQLVGEGQTVQEAVIKEIHPDRIVVEFDGRTIEMFPEKD